MTAATYEELSRQASVRKLRGMKLRALGDKDDRWEATLAFSDAARLELHAFAALVNPDASTEACCLSVNGTA